MIMPVIKAYHSTNNPDFKPTDFLHVGTYEQARMRGGKFIYEIEFQARRKEKRLKDNGSWKADNLKRHKRDTDVIVYLNRYEGLNAEDFIEVQKLFNIDRLNDKQFSRKIPAACDSWIILDHEIIRSVKIHEESEPAIQTGSKNGGLSEKG